MAECLLCDNHEAVIEDLDGQKRVHCPRCQTYTIANAILESPGLTPIRAELSRAVRFYCFRGQWDRAVIPDITSANDRIDWFHLFEEDREKLEGDATEALVERKPGDAFSEVEAWTVPIERVAKVLGVSQAEAREFVARLQERGIVRLETNVGKGRPIRLSIREFPPLYWWVKCQPAGADDTNELKQK